MFMFGAPPEVFTSVARMFFQPEASGAGQGTRSGPNGLALDARRASGIFAGVMDVKGRANCFPSLFF
jgi:hypothetical protein